MKSFPFYNQPDLMDCGPTCLRMISMYYGKNYSVRYLREHAFITREGVSMKGISDAAELIGFRTMGVKISLGQLRDEAPLPCILYWNQRHFVVCYTVKRGKFYIADPANKKLSYNEVELKKCWCDSMLEGEEVGAALLLEPGPDFYDREEEDMRTGKGLSFFFRYLTPYRR
ncbi:cysteine peptidase family C39 domain-containing protein, partial [uncultured Parabacteroides sp.]